jgi:alanyl-tRNA synthetase
MTKDQVKEVEEMVNKRIEDGLEVKKEERPYAEAVKSGALAFFKEKYPELVNVYSIGEYSKEICAGPHVKNTSELGKFKIIKEESSGAGIRRIRAVLE